MVKPKPFIASVNSFLIASAILSFCKKGIEGLEEIKQLSRLSKIKFAENEIDAFLSKLQNVIGLINQLQHVDTEGIQPLTSVVDTKIYTREDKVTDGGIEDDLFMNVPGKSADLAREIKCFIVPKMVE